MKKYFLSVLALTLGLTANAQSELYPQHFDLEQVTLLDGPFKTAQDLNIKHLLSYDVDRLLMPFVRQAGLDKKSGTKYYNWGSKHPNYDNWGGNGFDLSGHVGGHYMTALALAYASCHDAATKTKLQTRIDYMIAILKDCQDAYDSDQTGLYGFLGGQPMNQCWQALYRGDVGGFWNGAHPVPFYCQHKVLAGLRDLAVYTEDDTKYQRQTIAREMFRKISDWATNLVAKVSDGDMQGILNTEHGGMNETLADAYAMFGEAKYLSAAKKYSHRTMVDGMQSLNTGFLDNRHANTQVPKYVGFARISQTSTATDYKTAARNFWQDVTSNRTVCIGGNSVNEHFIAASAGNRYMDETNGPESCNTNNMLKLTEDLFDSYHDAKYADYYESTMYNHILSTQDPETGGYVYFTPLRPQSYRIYSKPNQDMWCCVGTGMENHVKYGHFIYTHNTTGGVNTLYVNLFTPSRLEDETFALTQETQFPLQEGTKLTINKAGTYTLAIRRPSWAGEGFAVNYNGTAQDVSQTKAGSYYKLSQSFKEGDVVEVTLPMTLRYETCPNLSDYIAFKCGPILLGARTTAVSEGDDTGLPYEKLSHEYALGERMGHAPDSYAPKKGLSSQPLLIGERKDVLSRIKAVSPMHFTIDVSRPGLDSYKWKTLTLEPYYALHHSRVNCYFYQQTEDNYQKTTWALGEAKERELNERTIDKVDVGQQQAEAGVVTHSSDSNSGAYRDEDYRDSKANGWIQIVLNNDDTSARDLAIMLRYTTADKGRMCKVYVNGKLLQNYTVVGSTLAADANGFYNVELPLGDMAYDSEGNALSKFTVRIVASSSTPNPGLYFIRLMKNYTKEDFSYRFKATDWGYTGDGGRVAQSAIKVDAEANTITLRASGDNNVCLKYGSDTQYEVSADRKYLVVRGKNLNRSTGKSYLWWLNGCNRGSSVAPTKQSLLSDGRVQIAWDITASNLTDNCKNDPWVLSTSYNAASTIFGLTASSSAKDVVINYIGFMTEDELNDATADGLHAIASPENGARPVYYTMNGLRHSTPQPGINIVSQGGTMKKIVY